jgi:hypothetical protein
MQESNPLLREIGPGRSAEFGEYKFDGSARRGSERRASYTDGDRLLTSWLHHPLQTICSAWRWKRRRHPKISPNICKLVTTHSSFRWNTPNVSTKWRISTVLGVTQRAQTVRYIDGRLAQPNSSLDYPCRSPPLTIKRRGCDEPGCIASIG